MSYILDALRKAEAERERGSVPGINAQPGFAGAQPGSAPARSRLWLVVLALGAALTVAIATALYLLLGRSANDEAPAPIAKAQVLVAPAASAASAVPAPSVAAAPPVTLPVPATRPAPDAIAPPVHATMPPAAPAARKARPPALVASAAPAASSAPAAPKTEPRVRVYALSELPDDIRRQLPQLSVGGSMYSPTPASRLVILNGQVLREGEHISPELSVQQIGPKGAVLEFKGYRFLLAF